LDLFNDLCYNYNNKNNFFNFIPMLKKEENSDFDIDNIQSQNNNTLNKSQKIAVISLAFFAFLIIILWSVQFKKTITGGTINKIAENETKALDNSVGLIQENDLAEKDTDGDGLNDWDELNTYLTSPYLEDSDSDGFSDREEIESGNDPNCPQGVDCYGIGSPYNKEGGITGDVSLNSGNILFEQLGFNENANAGGTGDNQMQDQELKNFLGGQLDAASLRNLLLESGMDENMLNQISNEDLIKSYEEMLKDNLE